MLKINFKNIQSNPIIQFIINGTVVRTEEITNDHKDDNNVWLSKTYECNTPLNAAYTLELKFINKEPNDTVVVDDKIIADKCCEINSITTTDEAGSNLDLEELVWTGNYYADNGDVYEGCLFFGPAGSYIINIEDKPLKQKLINRGDDLKDYEYYIKASELLKLINK